MCSFSDCRPLERGGCPCRAVELAGGELTAMECAAVTGMPFSLIRSVEWAVRARVARLKGEERRIWSRLLGPWPRRTESHWDMAYQNALPLPEGVSKKMLKQMKKKWKELGWK